MGEHGHAGPGFEFAAATRRGGPGNNTFFGKGIVDALEVVTFKG